MSRIFLSHSSNDNFEAIALRDWLAEQGWNDIYLDIDPEHGNAAGERWERKLYQHIDDCDVFMLFWSNASKESKWVRQEYEYALKRKGADDSAPPEIVPILLEGPPIPLPPPELSHIHFNDRLLYYMQNPKPQ